MSARVLLKPQRAKPFYAMHPWVYAGAIEAVAGAPADGAEVSLHTHTGNFIARGFYNSQSKIRVRLYSWNEAEPLDAAFFRRKLEQALRLRTQLGLGGPGQGCRLVYSESDGLSGLVVDQYDRWLAVQFTSLALAQRRETIADLLEELCKPEGIYLRTEKGIGSLEGLELQDGLLRGRAPEGPVVIEEHGLRLKLNLAEGQKTGTYLDQRDNRAFVAGLCVGRDLLDVFCYTGGFSLHAARAGAKSTLGIDVSAPALELARENAALNQLSQCQFERGDVFDQLAAMAVAGRRFGAVVLDPPKFARAAKAVEEALRGYRRLLALAMRLLEPEGILVMCCCSGLIDRAELHALMAQVAADLHRPLQFLDSRGAAPDHPVSAACPATSYLKCVVSRVL